jgi:hypothetical protein
MKTFTIILAVLCLSLSTLAAETEARRKAFVSSDIVPSVVSLTPESLTEAGDINPAAHKTNGSTWTVGVWVAGKDGSLKVETQAFVYVANLDEYRLQHPIRTNYVAKPGVVQRGLTLLDTLKANSVPVGQLGGAVIEDYYFVRTDDLPEEHKVVVFDLKLANITGHLRVGMVVDEAGDFVFRNAK